MISHQDRFIALKTISGACFYTLSTSNFIMEMHREQMCWHLQIDKSDIYCLELTGNGFVYTTKYLQYEYVHDNYSHEYRKAIMRSTPSLRKRGY